MNINSVTGQNFLTLGEFGINLKDRGLLLIQGENEDDPSADSNGAGKSSLPDAISWALYGTTARGITGDAVVNRTIGKNCMVTVVLEEGDTMYYIARYRSPNALKVHTSAKGGGVPVEITKGTQGETQEVINKIMGCTLEVFNAAVYAGQEAMPDLPGMTDKQLKLLIEEAAGVEVLADAYAIAREAAADAEKIMRAAQSTVDNLTSQETMLATSITKFIDSRDTFETVRASSIAALKKSAAALLPKLKEEREKLAKMDSASIHKAVNDFEATTKAKKDALASDKKVSNMNLSTAKGLADSISRDTTKAEQRVKALEVDIEDLHKRVGEPCTACGKPILEKDLEEIEASLTAKLATARTDLGRINPADYAAAKLAVQAAQAKIDEIDAKLIDSSGDIAAFAGLMAQKAELVAVETSVAAIEKDIKKAVETAQGTKLQKNPYAEMLEEAERQVFNVRNNLIYNTKLRDGASAQYELLQEAAKVFGPSGVRAHILDTVTPFLNARTSDYLGTMTDGNIHAVWNTLQATAKGELRERFNIDVTNDKGAGAFAGLSGGEKRKVRLATTMALQDMVASRAEKPLNIFIADEIDNALDESGLERLMTVLEQKARERGTVLIISHNSLSDWCDQVVTVTKNAGISTIGEL